MTKKLSLLSILLLLSATIIHAKRYLISCALPGSCPITVYVDGEQYTLTKATQYAIEGEGVIDLELPEGKHTIQAFDNKGYEIYQISQNHVFDDQGNVLYLRVILGGSGHHVEKATPHDWEADLLTTSEPPATTDETATTTEEAPAEETTTETGNSYSSVDFGSDENLSTKHYLEKKAVETGANMFGTIGSAALSGMNYDADGYPNVQLSIGGSRLWGEFGRVKAMLGGTSGFTLYGGVGKDWIFDLPNKDRLAWHAGFGFYFTADFMEQSDFTIGLSYAETPVKEGGVVSLDFDYSYFFGDAKRFGFFVGGSAGVGEVRDILKSTDYNNDNEPGCFMWDLRLGLSIKLWQN